MHSASLFALLAGASLFAQTPTPAPAPKRLEFEVASIKPSAPPSAGQVNVGVHIDGAQFRCTFLSLRDYIRMAYDIKDYQLSGPDWIGSARFDIAAKLPQGGTREQVNDMMRSLLEDRFALKSHREKKEVAVYALTVAKGGLKMVKRSDETEAELKKQTVDVKATGGAGGVTVDLGRGASFTFGNNKFEGRKLPMTGLAESLGRFTDRPVLDFTEAIGTFDFVLEFSPEDFRAMMIRSAIAAGYALPPEVRKLAAEASSDSIFATLQTLGLKLEARKAPVESLVIDSANKLPTEN